jgi:hypothetical protein
MIDELVECPRCGYYSVSPDSHIYDYPPEEDPDSGELQQRRPRPGRMFYCTPAGVVERALPPLPPLEEGWGWRPKVEGRLEYCPPATHEHECCPGRA